MAVTQEQEQTLGHKDLAHKTLLQSDALYQVYSTTSSFISYHHSLFLTHYNLISHTHARIYAVYT